MEKITGYIVVEGKSADELAKVVHETIKVGGYP
jgi:hypothetical protein